jgi:small conductance mechanosensitive channel
MDDLWQIVHQFWLNYGGRILGAALILGAGWLLIRYLVTPLRRLLARSHMDPLGASFLVNSLRTVLLFAVLLGVLNQLGVETTSLLTLLGAVALAVSLSLQGSLANFASGLLILWFRIVRVGDQIESGDLKGRIVELLPFHAVLLTADNQRVTVPNTLLTNGPVRNHSAQPTRRCEWNLSVKAGEDLAAIKDGLRARLLKDPRILADPAPQVFVKDWADDKRVLTATAWTTTPNHADVQQEMVEALGLRLEELRKAAVHGPP